MCFKVIKEDVHNNVHPLFYTLLNKKKEYVPSRNKGLSNEL